MTVLKAVCICQWDLGGILWGFSLYIAGFPLVSAVSPLQVDQFAWELRFHPNRQLVAYVLDGLRHGFKLGFCPSQPLKLAKRTNPRVMRTPLSLTVI